jgi:hypothetical protein
MVQHSWFGVTETPGRARQGVREGTPNHRSEHQIGAEGKAPRKVQGALGKKIGAGIYFIITIFLVALKLPAVSW